MASISLKTKDYGYRKNDNNLNYIEQNIQQIDKKTPFSNLKFETNNSNPNSFINNQYNTNNNSNNQRPFSNFSHVNSFFPPIGNQFELPNQQYNDNNNGITQTNYNKMNFNEITQNTNIPQSTQVPENLQNSQFQQQFLSQDRFYNFKRNNNFTKPKDDDPKIYKLKQDLLTQIELKKKK